MLNYETILSSYDDKITLMEWLKKVEEALANASLSSVNITQPTANTAYFTFIFADGTTLVSPTLNLPAGAKGDKGDKGDTGATGADGQDGADGADGVSIVSVSLNNNNLMIYLSNGTIINAGTIQVPTIDVPSNQANIAFIIDVLENINTKQLTAYTSAYGTYGGYAGYKIQKNSAKLTEEEASSYMKSMCGSEYLPKYNYNNPTNTYFVKASNGLVLKPQYDATNGLVLYVMKKILTEDSIIPVEKVSGAMENPMTSMGDIIYGGLTGSPQALAKGTAGQVLKATATGVEWADESGGGSQLYLHSIVINDSYCTGVITIICDRNTEFTETTLARWLYSKGFNTQTKLLSASGRMRVSTNSYDLMGVFGTSADVLTFVGGSGSGSLTNGYYYNFISSSRYVIVAL